FSNIQNRQYEVLRAFRNNYIKECDYFPFTRTFKHEKYGRVYTFDWDIKKLDIDDFNQNLTLAELKANPPKISIEVTIKKGSYESEDDLVTVANWLTKLDSDYEATLTYEFFLPEKQVINYRNRLSEIPDDSNDAIFSCWKTIKHDFLRFYTYKIWGGDILGQNIADSESLNKFDFQFLDAIRDVERDMLTGKNTLLREIFDFFMDYDIKIDAGKDSVQRHSEIKIRKVDFSQKAKILVDELHTRIASGKTEILSYAHDTGASFNNAKPNFEGIISEMEMYNVLKLIVEYESGIKIPATHNGLGYNNLIYMSLLLAKMQVNADADYLDNNAKVFSTLAIEEPEAHLHPAMQYKFLKFLNENKKKRKVRQIFVTSHSTNITSAVNLDEIICLHNDNGLTKVGYPSRTFVDGTGAIQVNSKKYVERFLDATKSDMLFAQKVLFVEGLAEQVLMSIFAQYLNKSLEDNHVATINVGGRYFEHFLYLFDTQKEFTISKQIICLTDRDPQRKDITAARARFNKCYPFEYDGDTSIYEYQKNSFDSLYNEGNHPNITFYSQNDTFGKTLEYEIAYLNAGSSLILTDSIDNKDEVEELFNLYNEPTSTIAEFIVELRKSAENDRIIDSINNSTLPDDEKKRSIIASRYLNSVGKGENALDLAIKLKTNLEKRGTPEYQDFIVPEYIVNAINKLCP
ncbi:MAG: ATP-dependent endonuclease, partial [Flavobacterium sp.]